MTGFGCNAGSIPARPNNAQNHRVAAGDVDFSFRPDGNSGGFCCYLGVSMSKEIARRINGYADAIEMQNGSPFGMQSVALSGLGLLRASAMIVEAAGIAAIKLETRGGQSVPDSEGAYRVLMDALMPVLQDFDDED